MDAFAQVAETFRTASQWSGAEDRVRSTNVASDARYPWVALLLGMACESLRIRWDALENNLNPQTKGAIKLVPTTYANYEKLKEGCAA